VRCFSGCLFSCSCTYKSYPFGTSCKMAVFSNYFRFLTVSLFLVSRSWICLFCLCRPQFLLSMANHFASLEDFLFPFFQDGMSLWCAFWWYLISLWLLPRDRIPWLSSLFPPCAGTKERPPLGPFLLPPTTPVNAFCFFVFAIFPVFKRVDAPYTAVLVPLFLCPFFNLFFFLLFYLCYLTFCPPVWFFPPPSPTPTSNRVIKPCFFVFGYLPSFLTSPNSFLTIE